MKKKRISREQIKHYIIFGTLSLVGIFLSVFFFAKLNQSITNFREFEKQEKDIANVVAPLETENTELQKALDDPNIKWYCPNPNHNPDCKTFYSDIETEYDYEGSIVYVCYRCSEDEIVYVDPIEEHRDEIIERINDNQKTIDELGPRLAKIREEKNECSNQMQPYQVIAMISSPVSLVLVFLALFAYREN